MEITFHYSCWWRDIYQTTRGHVTPGGDGIFKQTPLSESVFSFVIWNQGLWYFQTNTTIGVRIFICHTIPGGDGILKKHYYRSPYFHLSYETRGRWYFQTNTTVLSESVFSFALWYFRCFKKGILVNLVTAFICLFDGNKLKVSVSGYFLVYKIYKSYCKEQTQQLFWFCWIIWI